MDNSIRSAFTKNKEVFLNITWTDQFTSESSMMKWIILSVQTLGFFYICESIPFLPIICLHPVLSHLGNRNVYQYMEAVLYLNHISV